MYFNQYINLTNLNPMSVIQIDFEDRKRTILMYYIVDELYL